MSFPFKRNSFGGKAKARKRHEPGKMNKAEQQFAEFLDSGTVLYGAKVLAWYFEPEKVRIADNCTLTPDFLVAVQYENGDIFEEYYEVKARWKSGPHWEEDARVKAKCFAEHFPHKRLFGICFNKQSGEWEREEF